MLCVIIGRSNAVPFYVGELKCAPSLKPPHNSKNICRLNVAKLPLPLIKSIPKGSETTRTKKLYLQNKKALKVIDRIKRLCIIEL